MLNEKIDQLIMEAIKEKDSVASATYRMIKNEFLKYKTAKNAKPIDDAAEIAIMQKMVKQREESIEDFKKANRQDLIVQEIAQINVIKKFLPKVATSEEIETYVKNTYPEGIEQKSMGAVIKEVKERFIGADGKIIADIVKSNIK